MAIMFDFPESKIPLAYNELRFPPFSPSYTPDEESLGLRIDREIWPWHGPARKRVPKCAEVSGNWDVCDPVR